jgi:hypothetical protein
VIELGARVANRPRYIDAARVALRRSNYQQNIERNYAFDANLDDALCRFQGAHDFSDDGTMAPGGGSERMLNRALRGDHGILGEYVVDALRTDGGLARDEVADLLDRVRRGDADIADGMATDVLARLGHTAPPGTRPVEYLLRALNGNPRPQAAQHALG